MYIFEEFIIAVYCLVDDIFKALTSSLVLRARGFNSGLSDAEVIAMEIIAEYQGIDSDQAIWNYFNRHWRTWFPHLPGRSSFIRHSANLWQYKQLIQKELATQLGAFKEDVHLIDSLPMRLCCITYAARCQSFQGIASYEYCAAKDEHFYGFRSHFNVSLRGVITGFSITPANADERTALWEITQGIKGLLIGDKGYLSLDLKRDRVAKRIQLVTPLRSNMKDNRSKEQIQLEQRLRRLIGTVK